MVLDCDKHGKGAAATVCGHLVRNEGQKLGFIDNSDEPGDLQGWCYACEHMFLQEDGRSEKFNQFCNFSLVCEDCYKGIRLHHRVSA